MCIVTKPQANHKLSMCLAVTVDPHARAAAYLRTFLYFCLVLLFFIKFFHYRIIESVILR